MKKIILFTVVFVVAFCRISPAQDNHTQPFKKGDRIAFLGNSITEGGHYHSYVWLYYMTHFPDRRIRIFNCGIGGDVIGDMYERLDSDVLARKPSVIFLTFGMNDTGYWLFLKSNARELADQKVAKSYHDYEKMEKRLKEYTDARKVIMSSTPFDETAKLKSTVFPGKNEAILRIDSFQELSARQNDWGFIDLTRSMTAINEREQKKDSAFTLEGEGRIHPDNDGHLVVAYLILKAQGLAGKYVADIDIDASKRKVNKSVNCAISQLKVTSNTVQFDYLARSLPFPIDTVARGWGVKKPASDALSVIPFMKKFNNERLAVKGLPGKEYVLKIDGLKIGKWSAEELANGINLAEQTRTPQYRQSLAIMHLNEERYQIENKFRAYYWIEYNVLQEKGLLFQDDLTAIDTVRQAAKTNVFVRGKMDTFLAGCYKSIREIWNQEMQSIVDKIYTINKPQSHKITLVKIQ